jgi:hypothetical protein
MSAAGAGKQGVAEIFLFRVEVPAGRLEVIGSPIPSGIKLESLSFYAKNA